MDANEKFITAKVPEGLYRREEEYTIEKGTLVPVPKAKREAVDYLYSKLNWDFIHIMAQIAEYAESKYGAADQYTESVLSGEKEPINHVFEHARAYLTGRLHDRYGTLEHQLAAIAYNAMMQFFYLKCGILPKNLYASRIFPNPSELERVARGVGSGPLNDTALSMGYTPGPRQATAEIPQARVEISGHKDFDRGVKRAVAAVEGSESLHRNLASGETATAIDRAPSFEKV